METVIDFIFFPINQINVYPFKRQLNKMFKYTQAICRLLPTYCLGVFDHFVGLTLEGLKLWQIWLSLGLRQLKTIFGVELK